MNKRRLQLKLLLDKLKKRERQLMLKPRETLKRQEKLLQLLPRELKKRDKEQQLKHKNN